MKAGLSYWLRNKLYIAVTNKTNSLTPIALRGPSFVMPSDSGFQPLSFEPTPEDIANEVDGAFEQGRILVDSMRSDEVVFAGVGEPLLRLDVISDAARMIKEKRHGVPLRVKTNGLIKNTDSFKVASTLAQSGIKHISIALMADNPTTYQKIMVPQDKLSFNDVCTFVIASVESGLTVTCTAVERPDVNIGKVRVLSESLGASNFHTYSYHP